MRLLDRLQTRILWPLAVIMSLTAGVMWSPHIPGSHIHAQAVGSGGVPGAGGGGGAVSSVFMRTGAVTAQTGDYTAAQVTGAATSGANSNITSLTGLTTPLSIGQGGIGATSLAAANIAATNVANTFSANQTLASGDNLILNGSSVNWTVSAANSLLLFSGSNYTNTGWLHTNTYANFGWGILDVGCYSWAATPTTNGSDTSLCQGGNGIVIVGNASNGGSGGTIKAANFQAGGTVFTVSGCGTPTATGGASAGTFAAGSATCNPVITPGKTATNGWTCVLQDETTATASFRQSAHSTTTCTLAGTNVASSDVIDVMVMAY